MLQKIIVVANQKGGAGKTTITVQLAYSLMLTGYKVLVVDADEQNTATRWCSLSDSSQLPASNMAAAGGKLHNAIGKVVGDYDFVLVDCPPSITSPATQSALLVADLAIVPVIPSPPDLWAALGIKQLIENAKTINEGLLAVLLLNQMSKTAIARNITEILAEFEMPIMESKLANRVAYRESAAEGLSVLNLAGASNEAKKEMEKLRAEVLSILGVQA